MVSPSRQAGKARRSGAHRPHGLNDGERRCRRPADRRKDRVDGNRSLKERRERSSGGWQNFCFRDSPVASRGACFATVGGIGSQTVARLLPPRNEAPVGLHALARGRAEQ